MQLTEYASYGTLVGVGHVSHVLLHDKLCAALSVRDLQLDVVVAQDVWVSVDELLSHLSTCKQCTNNIMQRQTMLDAINYLASTNL